MFRKEKGEERQEGMKKVFISLVIVAFCMTSYAEIDPSTCVKNTDGAWICQEKVVKQD